MTKVNSSRFTDWVAPLTAASFEPGALANPARCTRCNWPTTETPDGQHCAECGTTWAKPAADESALVESEEERQARIEAQERAAGDVLLNAGPVPLTDVGYRLKAEAAARAGLGGLRYNDGKPAFHLLDPYALEQCARVMGKGAEKYAPNNWRHGLTVAAQFGSLLRHVFAALSGEDRDKESGELHMAHAMVNCMFILWTLHARPDLDDRLEWMQGKARG